MVRSVQRTALRPAQQHAIARRRAAAAQAALCGGHDIGSMVGWRRGMYQLRQQVAKMLWRLSQE